MITTVLENKYINIDQDDIKAVESAILRKQLAGTADIVGEYEANLAEYFDVKHAMAVSSGTAALHLLLYLYNVSKGDEVILPPTAPIMSALPIIAVGAVPVFVDVQADNFSFEVKDLKKKITPKTKAIISVPMWGYPTSLQEVKEIAKSKNIKLIEDASHCHGSRNAKNLVGAVGDVSFFSTQERKLVATGEGGFILTNNNDVADRVREIRDFGKPHRKTPDLKNLQGQYGYLFGLNFRISAMSAALGISQLSKLDSKIVTRTKNAELIKKELSKDNWLKEIKQFSGTTPNYYSIVLNIDRDKILANDLAKNLYNHNIVSDTYRFGIKPLYELPIFAQYKSDCPNATALLKAIITLPTHEGLSQTDIHDMVLLSRQISDNN